MTKRARKHTDVPMPPAIAALPRDPRGYPVPWITCWRAATPDWTNITDHPVLGRTVTCDCAPGTGTAYLGGACVRQMAQGAIEHRCGTCGTPLHPGQPRAWVASGHQPDYPELPNCGPCAVYTVQVCPYIIGLRRGTVTGPGIDAADIVIALDTAVGWRRNPHPERTDIGDDYFRPTVPLLAHRGVGVACAPSTSPRDIVARVPIRQFLKDLKGLST